MARLLRSAIVRVLAVDHRDDVLEQVALVQRRISAERPGSFRRNASPVAVDVGAAVAERHDHEERLDGPLCQQVVENVVRPAVPVPRMMIVREPVEQVEHGIAAISRLLVSRRQIDGQLTGDAVRSGLVEQRPELSMRDVLDVIERGRVAAHGEQARGGAGDVADLHLRVAWIGEPDSVDGEGVDVHLRVERTDARGPDAVCTSPHFDIVAEVA